MAASLAYLDASALVKLVLPEPETAALRAALARWPERITSVVAEVEVRRAVRRATADKEAHRRADQVLAGLYRLDLVPDILASAAELQPVELRTLDAIHLASALELKSQNAVFAAYDRRLLDAAHAVGLAVASPGA